MKSDLSINNTLPRIFFIIPLLVIMIQCNSGKSVSNKTFTADSSTAEIDKLARKALLSDKRGCIYGNCVIGTGVFVYDEGNVYAGNFKNARRHGSGEMYYKDGSRFSGNYFEDLREGKGIFYFANKDKFSGQFLGGSPDEGIYYFSDGRIYQGSFSEKGNAAEGIIKIKGESMKCSLHEFTLACEN